ncbi:ribonuclease H-like domain-containing protein [Tanacetum coccineum]
MQPTDLAKPKTDPGDGGFVDPLETSRDVDASFSATLLQRIIALLHGEFAMTDLCSLTYFLGVSTHRITSGMILSQSKFAEEILERAHMQKCNSCKTLWILSRSLVLMVCLYMHDPCDPHFTTLKHILRYVRGYRVFLGDNLLSRQVTLSRSSAEAEYCGVANVVAETTWIRNLFRELHAPLFTATLVYCNNVNVVYMYVNPVQHHRIKHIEIDIHFVRDFVATGKICVLHVPSRFQYTDIFTKGLLTALFLKFRSSLNVRKPPVPTTGE